ncbi:DUF5994 family protein [Streptomyces scabiei]|uniref:DUF5994 family protein n=1 Tax=Streptomyces scabiei TaxID=1930 RepID=UPI001B3291AD|nr:MULTISPECIES: DUF5994 family protein [Streptomyces]MBP5892166.1 hypothetical protein [Streptomyces sp. LBUM 1481]MBP5922401.1 hypothetical protein [Streptomyces sp. LBUM 1483]MDX2685156.1 DUF5994 family protein [Streptomyces scabiei]MDX2749002.1 DUF5994 family protein [Streptomyces scabiei]MDX2803177.1 DUF5994 family protein [Streptomyces scabiei]
MSPSTGPGPPPRADVRAPARPQRTSPLPARLALRPPTFPPGPVCGAWWPRTDDLMTELPALTEAFDATRGRVSRMASHRDTWPATPCDLPVTGHTVKAAWFAAGFDPHMIRLFSYGVGRWDLLVVPPRTDTATAARLMAAAADPALHLTASELLAAERRLHAEDEAEAEREPGRTEHWEDEGGALRRPSAPRSLPPASVTVRDPLFTSARYAEGTGGHDAHR